MPLLHFLGHSSNLFASPYPNIGSMMFYGLVNNQVICDTAAIVFLSGHF